MKNAAHRTLAQPGTLKEVFECRRCGSDNLKPSDVPWLKECNECQFEQDAILPVWGRLQSGVFDHLECKGKYKK